MSFGKNTITKTKSKISYQNNTTYHPSSNGAVEQFIQTFTQALKAGSNDKIYFDLSLTSFLLTYVTQYWKTSLIAANLEIELLT